LPGQFVPRLKGGDPDPDDDKYMGFPQSLAIHNIRRDTDCPNVSKKFDDRFTLGIPKSVTKIRSDEIEDFSGPAILCPRFLLPPVVIIFTLCLKVENFVENSQAFVRSLDDGKCLLPCLWERPAHLWGHDRVHARRYIALTQRCSEWSDRHQI
jgi:hypothetical protein